MTDKGAIYVGILGAFLMEGLKMEYMDTKNNILYISLPEDSYSYHMGTNITCAEDYAKSVKENIIQGVLNNNKVRMKFKVRKGEYWTKAMGEKNYQENIGNLTKILNI